MKKIAILITALTPLLFASCKKVEERADLSIYVTKVDNTTYTQTNQPGTIQCAPGTEFDVVYYFESKVPIDEYIYGTDFEKDQSQYLTGMPAEGALTGNFTFHFVVDDLLEDYINFTNTRALRFEILNEEGVVAKSEFSLQKTN